MKVVVRESTMVRPAVETPTIKLWLSSLDLMAPNFHVAPVYFYRPNNGAPNFFDAKVMKDALSRVLVVFYPLAGRFKQGEDGRVVIDCQGQGAFFLEAESVGVIHDFGDFAPGLESLKLFPVMDYSLGIDSYPLLVFQVTYFKCGGVSLAASIHNRAMDGSSTFHFMNTWSDMARGLDIKLPPFIDRTLLRAQDPPRPIFEHAEYHPDPAVKSSVLQVPLDETKIVSSVFKLTRDQLNKLKEKSKEVGYNTFEILSGHVWKCVCEARGLPDDHDTKLDIPTSGRARLQPPLPPGYLGNVVFTTSIIATAGEIKSKPFWHATSKIHGALATMNNNYLKSALDYLEQHLDDHKPDASYKHTNLRIISWAKFPIHDADFGWGRPVYMETTRILAGKCLLSPSPINDGSLSIVIALEVEQMKLFSKLLYAIGSAC